ncbi:hypothetical protein Tsp_05510 [Trichinella spiralis]|uniref:hypothetical protein n=1 Tax=Trichinella spiralis TaxID=6334 RepID=UPI0001EFDB98|nr:hypothetical protein Tsp_05510 [Trichinella spiralis]
MLTVLYNIFEVLRRSRDRFAESGQSAFGSEHLPRQRQTRLAGIRLSPRGERCGALSILHAETFFSRLCHSDHGPTGRRPWRLFVRRGQSVRHGRRIGGSVGTAERSQCQLARCRSWAGDRVVSNSTNQRQVDRVGIQNRRQRSDPLLQLPTLRNPDSPEAPEAVEFRRRFEIVHCPSWANHQQAVRCK